MQVFTVTNRGGMPARFKVYFRKPDPHTKLANHGYVHYSLAGVVSFPSIAAHFTVEFHCNVVGSFSNVLVLQTETQEIEVPFEARVNPQVRARPLLVSMGGRRIRSLCILWVALWVVYVTGGTPPECRFEQ